MEPNIVESGVQLFSRLNRKPFLEGINRAFFPESGPFPNQVIEVSGEDSTPKNNILIDFIIRCILPTELNEEWKGSGVIFINAEFQIDLMGIIKALETHVKKMLTVESKKKIIETSLKRLTIVNCYTQEDVEMTFYNLEKLICNKDNVSLVVIDNIAANYWIAKSENSTLSHFQYSLKMLEVLHGIVKDLNVVVIFGRHERGKRKELQNVDYRIEFKSEKDCTDKFSASITNYEKQTTVSVPFRLDVTVQFDKLVTEHI